MELRPIQMMDFDTIKGSKISTFSCQPNSRPLIYDKAFTIC